MAFQQGTFPPFAGVARHRAKPFELCSSLTNFVRAHSQVELSRATSQISRGWNQQPRTKLHERRSHGGESTFVIGREIDGGGILVLPMPVAMLLAEAEGSSGREESTPDEGVCSFEMHSRHELCTKRNRVGRGNNRVREGSGRVWGKG